MQFQITFLKSSVLIEINYAVSVAWKIKKYNISVPENNLLMKMTANIIEMPFRKGLMCKCIYNVQILSFHHTVH